jgi:hypothetical protein
MSYNRPGEQLSMPITAYVDGSGMDGSSGILALAVCVMDSNSIEPFNQRWNAVLDRYSLKALHMREIGAQRRSDQLWGMLRDLIKVVSQSAADFLYLRTCCVVMADYKGAKQVMGASLRTPEELCVDFCLGGLSIPAEDLAKDNTVTVKFDNNEPFLRCMDRVWRKARKNPQSGWPHQVQDIQSASALGNPGMQVADMFVWALNRHQCREDAPLLFSASFMSIRHSACIWDGNPDFAPRRALLELRSRDTCAAAILPGGKELP